MKRLKIKILIVWMSGMAALVAMVCLPADRAFAEVRKIIRDSDINNDYLPGSGTPIGKVRKVYGKVFIVHEDMKAVYVAQNDFALYAGDTLTTKETGRITLVLKDDSVLTLAPGTTMVLNESVFDPTAKKRSALVNLVNGKARFFVKKFADFQYSTFNVKSKSSVVGVRGSDFIIEQVGDKTIITALGMTILEVTNSDYPLAVPITVNSFQQLVVALGELPGNPFNVTEEQLTNILNELGIPTDDENSDDDDDDAQGDDDDDVSGQDDGSSFNDQSVSPYSP